MRAEADCPPHGDGIATPLPRTRTKWPPCPCPHWIRGGPAIPTPRSRTTVRNAAHHAVSVRQGKRLCHYRKDPDEDKALDADFGLFLDKMKIIEKETWDAESGKGLFEKLGGKCTLCHDTFQ